jgi:ABC-2 type transport system permease protein
LVFVITAFTMASLGILIGVISANSRSTILFSQLIFLPSMILGGLMVPSSMLPPALYRVSLFLPTTYAMNAWRGLAFGLPPTLDPRWSLLILLASGIIAYGMAIYLFNWDSKNRRAGRNPLLGLLAMLPFVLGALFLVG